MVKWRGAYPVGRAQLKGALPRVPCLLNVELALLRYLDWDDECEILGELLLVQVVG